MSPVDAGYRHGKRRAGRPAALLTALLVAGCAVGPDFHTPAALALDRYTEGETPSATVAAATRGGAQQRLDLGRDIAGDWWTLFRSPRLTALVEQALRANPDLAAQATLREAEEDLRAGEGSLLPTITASGSTTREEDSPYSYGSAFSTGGKPKPLDRFTVYQGTFNLSYTIDLFGGIRRQIEELGAQVDYERYELEATYLGLTSRVAMTALQEASFIVTVAVVSARAFVLMIPWEIRRRNPMIDIRMVATRQFGACFVVMLAAGAILLATTQFLPRLVEEDFGYTATSAGLVLSPGGIVTMVMMFVVGRLSGKVQPKYLIMAGAVIVALSMYDLTNTCGDLGFWFFARSRMLLGVGLPLIFLTVITASYNGVPPDKTDQASALMNAARNIGGSIGVSFVSNIVAHREQFHQSRLVENAIPSRIQYQDTLQQVTSYFSAHGSSQAQAEQQAIAWIGQQVQTQASFLAYMDAFWVMMLISLAVVPLALVLRNVWLAGAAPEAH